MAPEQTTNAKLVDARADVWSLGVTLYQALTGVVPFEEMASFVQLHLAINTQDTPPLQEPAPWVDPSLAVVVHGTMLRGLESRCPSVVELAAALEPYAAGSDELTAGMLGPIPSEMRQVRPGGAQLPTMWTRPGPASAAEPVSEAEPDPLIGQHLAERYWLLRCLGQGGMVPCTRRRMPTATAMPSR